MTHELDGHHVSRDELLLIAASSAQSTSDEAPSAEPEFMLHIVIWAVCPHGRSIHVSEKQLAQGSIICGLCAEPFVPRFA
jgi:hypothetical protein